MVDIIENPQEYVAIINKGNPIRKEATEKHPEITVDVGINDNNQIVPMRVHYPKFKYTKEDAVSNAEKVSQRKDCPLCKRVKKDLEATKPIGIGLGFAPLVFPFNPRSFIDLMRESTTLAKDFFLLRNLRNSNSGNEYYD